MRQFSYLSRLKTREDGSSRVATTSWPECMTGIWIIATPLNGNITEIATPAIIRWLKKNFPWLLALVLGLSLSSNQSLIIRQIRQLYIHWWKWRVPRPCVPRPPVGTPNSRGFDGAELPSCFVYIVYVLATIVVHFRLLFNPSIFNISPPVTFYHPPCRHD